jgi:hypothetical protein
MIPGNKAVFFRQLAQVLRYFEERGIALLA